MNKRDRLLAILNRDLALALSRFQRTAYSARPWNFSKTVSPGMPVTFIFWQTYFVIELTLDGESVGLPGTYWGYNKLATVAGKRMNNE
jgi:hypothetical protein